MTDRTDSAARHRILTDFRTTLFVEAAAGTGKTTVLIGRIVALVREGVSTLDRIVAVTFTEKAAGEMKLRLRTEIERARQDAAAEERERLERALSELELARVGTIHAFCGDLLRERPVQAGIDPLFEVAAEDEAEGLANQAFELVPGGARRPARGHAAHPPTAIERPTTARDAARRALQSDRASRFPHHSLPKTRFVRIDGEVRQGSDTQQCLRTARSGVGRARPSQAKREFEPHCNRSHISQEFAEGARR